MSVQDRRYRLVRRQSKQGIVLPVTCQLEIGHNAVNHLHQLQKLLHRQSDGQFTDAQTAVDLTSRLASIQYRGARFSECALPDG